MNQKSIIPKDERLKEKFSGTSTNYLKERVKKIDKEVEKLIQSKREIKKEESHLDRVMENKKKAPKGNYALKKH